MNIEEELCSDLWFKVFEFLEPLFIVQLSILSKNWMKLTKNEVLWEIICKRNGFRNPNNESWLKIFILNKNIFKWSLVSDSIQKVSNSIIKQNGNKRMAYCKPVIDENLDPFLIRFKILGSDYIVGVGLTREENAIESIDELPKNKWMYTSNGFSWSEDIDDNSICGYLKFWNEDIITIYVDTKNKKAEFYKNKVYCFTLNIGYPCLITGSLSKSGEGIEIMDVKFNPDIEKFKEDVIYIGKNPYAK